MEKEKWFLVGIMPPNTFPDKAYYFDRWKWIQAKNEAAAIEEYSKARKGWLMDEEKPWVTVHSIRKEHEDKHPSAWTWLREQGLV